MQSKYTHRYIDTDTNKVHTSDSFIWLWAKGESKKEGAECSKSGVGKKNKNKWNKITISGGSVQLDK